MNIKTPFTRFQERALSRWNEADYPGGAPRFQLRLLGKDIAVFVLMPLLAIALYKTVETATTSKNQKPIVKRPETRFDQSENRSQVIMFQSKGKSGSVFSKRAPGTLVRVRLLNVVEAGAPVHAQIIDDSLGREFVGGTLLGDATPENDYKRIKINFRFARHPSRPGVAVPISAHAMSLDGTLGLNAEKKEGFFARSVIRGSANGAGATNGSSEPQDFKTLVARAVAAGLMQEFQSEAGVANTRAQLLILKPTTEFFAELTDFFPGQP